MFHRNTAVLVLQCVFRTVLLTYTARNYELLAVSTVLGRQSDIVFTYFQKQTLRKRVSILASKHLYTSISDANLLHIKISFKLTDNDNIIVNLSIYHNY